MSDKEIFYRVVTAIIIGSIIGAERERKRKPAGFITITMVCFGAAVLGVLEELIIYKAISLGVNPPEFTRIAAQVVSGIGFLGAGVIFHNNENLVTGLTTASIIWVTAVLGLVSGYGFIKLALSLMVAVMVITLGMRSFENYLKSKNQL